MQGMSSPPRATGVAGASQKRFRNRVGTSQAGGGGSGQTGGAGGVGGTPNIISASLATTLSVGEVSGGLVYFAGGGGGSGPTGGGAKGLGGGTAGAGSGTPTSSALANTGGGTGGGLAGAGTGGSGVVIVRYLSTYGVAKATTGNPSVRSESGYIVYVWTTSGSITF
jgi:hypothetical protein